ncbi:hypothetical protein V6C27_14385 [Peptococcaceae bacterium 1198_IL3148]
MAKEILINLLMDKPIAYHADIAKAVGSVTSGLFLSQLLYWTGKGADPEGWIYKTQSEWYDETGLSRREQETARKKLKQLKVLQEERRGLPARLYYRIDFDRLIELLKSFYDDDENPATPAKPGMVESAKQECIGAPNWNGGKRHTGKAESDIHTITENTNREEEEEDARAHEKKK